MDEPTLRTIDPMGDSCCRERLTRLGVQLAGPDPISLMFKCDVCGLVWLQVGDLPPYSLTREAMDFGGFGQWLKGKK